MPDGRDKIEIGRIDRMIGSVVGSGTVQAGIIAGGDVLVVSLDNAEAVAQFYERFRALLGEGAQPRPLASGAFALGNGDTTLVISEGFAHALPKHTQGLDRYLFLQFDLWREHAQRYVPLAATGELGTAIQPQYGVIERTENGYETVLRYDDVRLAVADYPQMSLVGEPGSGKSTALRLLALDAAQQAARSDAAPLPLRIEMADYRRLEQLPQQFLEEQWSQVYRAPGVLADRLNEGQMVLLLDGLNEMPWSHEHPYREWVYPWRRACEDWRDLGNRIVVTCRTLDNSEPLNMPEVKLEPFDVARIGQFLHLHLQEEIAETLFQQLQVNPDLIELFRVPYALVMLTEIVKERGGSLPHSRAGLFTQVVRDALVREVKKNNPYLTEVLLNRLGRRHLQTDDFIERHPFYLADHPAEDAGRLVPAQGILARQMQAGAPVEGGGRRITESEARAALQSILPDEQLQGNVLQVGADANIFETDDMALPPLWFFHHHQLQEYFAARNLVNRLRSREPMEPQVLWTVRWKARDLEPLDPTMLGRGQRYPQAAETTPWEESTVLAAGLLADDEALATELVHAVLPYNPVLAARCLLELQSRPNRYEWPPFSPQLAAVAEETRQELLLRLTNPEADRRARLGAGFALGDLGDPRFPVQRTSHNDIAFIAPRWIEVPAGSFMMGSPDSPFDYERPVHEQPVTAFRLAAYPVTVAEYACFVAAGGYGDEQWWETDDARAWRRGQLAGLGQSWVRSMQAIREQERYKGEAAVREWLRAQREDYGRDEADVEFLEKCILLDNEAFRAYQDELRSRYDVPDGQDVKEPAFWTSTDLTNPSQPVVGVSWYEARAYAKWLSHCLGIEVRLATESEWEYAACGPHVWTYPWGHEFDLDRANVAEGCIRRASPVGAFPAGASYWRVDDMGSNVWEWTSSLWGDDPGRPTTGKYPYDPGDGREDPHAPPLAYRILRGDSFRIGAIGARCAARNWFNPYRQFTDVGFRLAAPAVDNRKAAGGESNR